MLERRKIKRWGRKGCSFLRKLTPVHVQTFIEMFAEKNDYSAESG